MLKKILDLQKRTSSSWAELLKAEEELLQTLPPSWDEALKAFTEMQGDIRMPNGGMMSMAIDTQRNLPLVSQKLSAVLDKARSTMPFTSRIADLDRHLMPLVEISPQFSGLQKAILDAACQVTPIFPQGDLPVEVFDEPLSEKLNKTWDELIEIADAAVEKTLESNIEIKELPSEGTIQTLVFVIFCPLFFCAVPSGIDEWLEMLLRATIEFCKSLLTAPTPEKIVVAVSFGAFLKTAVNLLSKKDKDKPRSSECQK